MNGVHRHDARARANYCLSLIIIIDLGVIDVACEREAGAGLLETVSCCDRTQYGSKIDQSDGVRNMECMLDRAPRV